MTEPITVAVRAARKAGARIRETLGHPRKMTEKASARDLVTEMDKECEGIIREEIGLAFPDHGILGEEGVAPGWEAAAAAERAAHGETDLWVVDPIDGTTSFIHGFPGVSVSIAYARQGVLTAGAVYDPIRDEMFCAVRGQGATCNGQTIHVDEAQSLSDGLLATGFPNDTERALPLNMRGLQRLITTTRGVRNMGSAALHFAYVASGRLSGFWEYNLNAWDMAAGVLLVMEAGGLVSDINGREYDLSVRDVMASNGHIHQALAERLNSP